ncbi:dipeptide/oligopeptide/nickel ABC transporter permease/ATP-binding protein [Dactylosporangium fulvum]|uniref:Dipeptide/oligopeptide/nickel ABC transporter permease/ATP-binding protein n=1 Tax=Dactylosporangium fulvum TaxID=53359 RepID=A0ABY5W6Q1_9ACTN|nr:dipeptide/oligopeptide/nickel ABC transporter permease/ATP-binding protein [Dactylosporangium fulvum]UWP85562.1 dipeptide/oligopeptide/nickel ABC transporter permease/ATP-binding protein [Dactylosporangium fulvum]
MTRLKRVTQVFRTPGGLVGGIVLLVIAAIAVVGPGPWHSAATAIDPEVARAGVSNDHLLGTDDLGRDVLARILAATRLSLLLALAATGIGAVLGIPFGAASGLFAPRWRRLAGRLIAVMLAFPAILTALIVCAILGPGQGSAVLAVGLAVAPGFARLSQTLGATIAGSEYVAAARVTGVGGWRLFRYYALPNIAEPMIIAVMMVVSDALLATAALGFLGLGVQSPSFDWGGLLGDGLRNIYIAPLAAIAPGVAVVLTGLAFNLVGDALAGGSTPRHRLVRRRRHDPVQRHEDPAPTPTEPSPNARGVLEVDRLLVEFGTADSPHQPVRGVSFSMGAGEMVGIVGESGSGKTLTALAVAQLLPYPGRSRARRLALDGQEIQTVPAGRLRRLLGTRLAVVFQDPLSSLNPALRLERQLTEKILAHHGMSRRVATQLAVERLGDVRINAPSQRIRQLPHQLSGGMRQRVMIAMGIMGTPALLIADEPTTALDVTVQAQIIDVLRELNAVHGTAVLLISHDLSVVTELCDRVMVMYAGRIIEDMPRSVLIAKPAHPYTRALMASIPSLDMSQDRPLAVIPGQSVSAEQVQEGCPFAPRCLLVIDRCRQQEPPLVDHGAGRVACWRADAELPDESSRNPASVQS